MESKGESKDKETTAFNELVTGAIVYKCDYGTHIDIMDMVNKITKIIYHKKTFNEKIHLYIMQKESEY